MKIGQPGSGKKWKNKHMEKHIHLRVEVACRVQKNMMRDFPEEVVWVHDNGVCSSNRETSQANDTLEGSGQ